MIQKLFADPFLKNQNSAYLWINILKFYIYFVFTVCQVEHYRQWLKLSCRPLAFTSYQAFLKSKERSGTSFSASFSAWFLKKNISVVIFYYLTKFQCLVAFTFWDIGKYVYSNCLPTRLWRQNFESNLIFQIKGTLIQTWKSANIFVFI